MRPLLVLYSVLCCLTAPKALFSTADCEHSRRMERWAFKVADFSKKVQHLGKREKQLLSNSAHEAQTHNGDAGPWRTLASFQRPGSAQERLMGIWETQWSGGLALTLTCVNEPVEVRVQLLPSWVTPKPAFMSVITTTAFTCVTIMWLSELNWGCFQNAF